MLNKIRALSWIAGVGAAAAFAVGDSRAQTSSGLQKLLDAELARFLCARRLRSVGGPFTLGGRQFAVGTALFRTADNPADLHARLSALAAKHGAEVVPIDTTYAGVIGDAVINRLKDWLRSGGTLITIAEATRWATANNVGLLDTTPLLY
jgi:hypothetical protein